MNCQMVKTLLLDYQDTMLSSEQRAGIDAHLSGCGSCRAERAETERVMALLHAQAVPQPSAHRWARLQRDILTAVTQRAPSRHPSRHSAQVLLPWWSWSAAAAALLLWLVWTPVTERLLPHRSDSLNNPADGSNNLGPLITDMMTTTPSVLSGLEEGPASSPLDGLDQLNPEELQHVEQSLGDL